jgi:hypothetical protein
MGHKGVSKRKPSQTKSKNLSEAGANSSISPVVEKQATKPSEILNPSTLKKTSSDWNKNSKKK